MGNSKILHVIIILLLSGLYNFSYSQKDEVLYKFVITVSSQEDPIPEAEVRVFDKNEVLSTTYSDKKGKFEVLLLKDSKFTVEISKEGYYPKRILFITEVTPGVGKLPALKLEAELISLEVYKDIESTTPEATSILDFPSFIIEYDDDLDDFTYREAYYRHITDGIKNIGND